MKTVVINNANSSSSSGQSRKLVVTDSYVEPIFKIEKIYSNKSSSNEHSSGSSANVKNLKLAN